MLDFDTCRRVLASRDPRFDGRFVVSVSSTGVYCASLGCYYCGLPMKARAAGPRWHPGT